MPKITSLEDSRDLSQMTLEDLQGNLKVHEIALKRNKARDEVKSKSLDLQASSSEDTKKDEKKKKRISPGFQKKTRELSLKMITPYLLNHSPNFYLTKTLLKIIGHAKMTEVENFTKEMKATRTQATRIRRNPRVLVTFVVTRSTTLTNVQRRVKTKAKKKRKLL